MVEEFLRSEVHTCVHTYVACGGTGDSTYIRRVRKNAIESWFSRIKVFLTSVDVKSKPCRMTKIR